MIQRVLINSLAILILCSFVIISLIGAQEYDPHKINVDLQFSFSDNLASSCNVTTMNKPNGEQTVLNLPMTKPSQNTFLINISQGNFSETGIYCFNIVCDDGYGNVCRNVTPNGEKPEISKGIIQIVLTIIIFIFLIFSIFGIFIIENYIGRFALYWISHILIIAGSFIAWNMASNFLTGTPFISGFFRLVFFFFMISAFPMVILSLAWIFYIHTMNDDIKKMMDRGMDEGEAYNRARRKR